MASGVNGDHGKHVQRHAEQAQQPGGGLAAALLPSFQDCRAMDLPLM